MNISEIILLVCVMYAGLSYSLIIGGIYLYQHSTQQNKDEVMRK